MLMELFNNDELEKQANERILAGKKIEPSVKNNTGSTNGKTRDQLAEMFNNMNPHTLHNKSF